MAASQAYDGCAWPARMTSVLAIRAYREASMPAFFRMSLGLFCRLSLCSYAIFNESENISFTTILRLLCD